MAFIVEPRVLWLVLDSSPQVSIVSKLIWRTDRPMEITAAFGAEGDSPEVQDTDYIRVWRFSRDLLTEAAASGSAGLGDVHVEIDHASRLILRLDSPTGTIRLRTQAATVLEFVQRTLDEVAQDTETDMLPLSDDDLREMMLDWGLM
jgi:hypothetical protein